MILDKSKPIIRILIIILFFVGIISIIILAFLAIPGFVSSVVFSPNLFFLSSDGYMDSGDVNNKDYNFYLNKRTISYVPPDTQEYWILIQENIKTGQKEKIDSGYINELFPSPDGRYFVYTNYASTKKYFEGSLSLVIFDIPKQEKIYLTLPKETHFLISVGWSPVSNVLYYTDSEGIKIFDLSENKIKTVVADKDADGSIDCFGEGFTKNGNLFVYNCDFQHRPVDPFNSQLNLFNIITKEQKILFSTNKGDIRDVEFSTNYQNITFVENYDLNYDNFEVKYSIGLDGQNLIKISENKTHYPIHP